MRDHITSIIIVMLAALAAFPADGQVGRRREYCEVTLTAENQMRIVDGAVNTECGAGIHSAPFGNWGVSSNYGNRNDRDQFRGWKWEDGPSTKRQWNSCTTSVQQYRAPNSRYYTYHNNFYDQQRHEPVMHGKRRIRRNYRVCSSRPGPGCSTLNNTVFTERNYMTLYEMDRPDRDDYITKLTFPSTSVTLTNCDQQGCDGDTTQWSANTGSSRPLTGVSAEMRMVGTAEYRHNCRR